MKNDKERLLEKNRKLKVEGRIKEKERKEKIRKNKIKW